MKKIKWQFAEREFSEPKRSIVNKNPEKFVKHKDMFYYFGEKNIQAHNHTVWFFKIELKEIHYKHELLMCNWCVFRGTLLECMNEAQRIFNECFN